ncbi:MAG: phosphoglycolate phosphatase [Hyphomicrobiaceae bacterium]|nr:phosphoglycolate phosphatase [Hyphomicrobiaceae bacterium]MCC0022922.1 phosphoglycolate phosphatase [Hyphomicrobiaceae bacterium]
MENSDWPKAVLFDLDGTLIDSVPDLAAAVNKVLEENGHPPLETGEVRTMIGHGVGKLVERAFAARQVSLSDEGLTPLVDRMMHFYMADLTGGTTLLPGARTTLTANCRNSVKTGIITNKPQQATDGIVAHFELGACLDVVLGGDSVPNKKPHPDLVLTALAKLGVSPEDALVVGDSAADVGAARAAGVKVIIVEGGYTNETAEGLGADGAITTLADLPEAVSRLRSNN